MNKLPSVGGNDFPLSSLSLFLSLQLSSEEVVREYVKRLQIVGPLLNVVIEERYAEAIEDAKRADQIVADTSPIYMITNYPLLGVPFTVKV